MKLLALLVLKKFFNFTIFSNFFLWKMAYLELVWVNYILLEKSISFRFSNLKLYKKLFKFSFLSSLFSSCHVLYFASVHSSLIYEKTLFHCQWFRYSLIYIVYPTLLSNSLIPFIFTLFLLLSFDLLLFFLTLWFSVVSI